MIPVHLPESGHGFFRGRVLYLNTVKHTRVPGMTPIAALITPSREIVKFLPQIFQSDVLRDSFKTEKEITELSLESKI